MGKSLTLLALTMHTLDRGCWPGATLIVAPKSSSTHAPQLIPRLLRLVLKLSTTGICRLRSEVPLLFSFTSALTGSRHLYPNTLKVHLHHGFGTGISQEDISVNDIVLTTYETLCSDMNSSGTLSKATWFRIVLDEGKNNTLQACPPG